MAPEQTFHDHIRELRHRVAWIMLALGGGSIIGYAFRKPIIAFLQHPLGGPLFYSSPAGSFNFILKTAGMLGFTIALPLIVYHIIRFAEPALPVPLKRRLIASVVIFSTILAITGAAFGFFVMVPMSLHFFAGYSTATIKPLISVDEYLSYVISVLVTFALLFQIPLGMLFINRVKPMRPRQLLKYQRYIVVGAFAIAVILPFTYDPISQFVMAVPIVFLYYFSVLLIWIANRRVVYAEIISEQEIPSAAPLAQPNQAQWTPVEPAVARVRLPDELDQTLDLSAYREVEPTLVQTAMPVVPVPPAATFPARPSPEQRYWQSKTGGLLSAEILKTAVDVLKPGAISGRPLKLEQPDPMRTSSYNLIDLSNQT